MRMIFSQNEYGKTVKTFKRESFLEYFRVYIGEHMREIFEDEFPGYVRIRYSHRINAHEYWVFPLSYIASFIYFFKR